MTETSILIVSPSATIRALLEQMLVAEGVRSTSAWGDERAEDALRRLRPARVILDCDHDASSLKVLVERARAMGSDVVLFSPSRDSDFVRNVAARLALPWFTLPIGRAELTELLAQRSVGAPGRGTPGRGPTWSEAVRREA